MASLTNFTLTPLSGGSNGTVPTTWSNYFDALRTADIPFAYYVVPVTPSQSIHAELSAVVTELSTSGYPLRAVVGGQLGETLQFTLARKAALYSPRVSLLGDDFLVKMGDGRQYKMPAYIATAFVVGILSGLPVGTPLTYKQLRILQSLRGYSSDELENLYTSGVIAVEKVRNLGSASFRFTSDPTTLNNDNDPVGSTISLGEETDFLVNDLRAELDNTFIGTRSTATTATDIKTAVSTFLLVKKNAGIINDYDATDIVASLLGDTVNVTFTVYPARGIKKIIATMNYQTVNQTA